MKKFIWLFFILIFITSCRNNIDYKSISLFELQSNCVFQVDENNNVIDTFPPYLRNIRNYNLKTIDTNVILLSNSNKAYEYALKKLDSIYGKKEIETEYPLNIYLVDNKYWYINGSMPKPPSGAWIVGGVAEILISKYDGKIILVNHGE